MNEATRASIIVKVGEESAKYAGIVGQIDTKLMNGLYDLIELRLAEFSDYELSEYGDASEERVDIFLDAVHEGDLEVSVARTEYQGAMKPLADLVQANLADLQYAASAMPSAQNFLSAVVALTESTMMDAAWHSFLKPILLKPILEQGDVIFGYEDILLDEIAKAKIVAENLTPAQKAELPPPPKKEGEATKFPWATIGISVGAAVLGFFGYKTWKRRGYGF